MDAFITLYGNNVKLNSSMVAKSVVSFNKKNIDTLPKFFLMKQALCIVFDLYVRNYIRRYIIKVLI